MNVSLLLSGGLDSLALLHHYYVNDYRVFPQFFDYGQLAISHELSAAERICGIYKLQLSVFQITQKKLKNIGLMRGRNSLLVLSSYFANVFNEGKIAIGIHSGTSYPDCGPDFIDRCQRLIDLDSEGEIKVEAPFLNWSKREIWQYCIDNRLDIESTYSCEMGEFPPCGVCNSCLDIRKLNEGSKKL